MQPPPPQVLHPRAQSVPPPQLPEEHPPVEQPPVAQPPVAQPEIGIGAAMAGADWMGAGVGATSAGFEVSWDVGMATTGRRVLLRGGKASGTCAVAAFVQPRVRASAQAMNLVARRFRYDRPFTSVLLCFL